MSIYTQTQPSLNARMIKVLWRQQQELLKKSPDCVTPIINDEDPIDIQADIEGPEGTPYESGIFRVKLFIPSEFPQLAPKGYFMTKIFHPNVSEKGEICVNTLKRDWNPKQWSLYNLFEVIKCLLIVPFPQSSLNEEAGKMFMDNYDEYFRVAKMLTEIHAKKKVKKKDDDDDDNIDMDNEKAKNDVNDMNNNKNEKEENNNKDEDIIMENNNESAKKLKNSEDKKTKKTETINEDIDNEKSDSNSKEDEMDNSFIYDNLNGENNSCSLFSNNTNNKNNNHLFNYDNDNFFDNFNITRSKTIKFCERPKCNFFHLNSQGESATSKIFHNSIKQFSRINSISSINSSTSNISNYEIQKVSTFKEKPKLGSLPLMSSNSIKTKSKNNPYGFFRSKTLNLSKNNETKKNNKDEINKWLMRI
jgi:ubiquitin-conjugating enzyme E2 S